MLLAVLRLHLVGNEVVDTFPNDPAAMWANFNEAKLATFNEAVERRARDVQLLHDGINPVEPATEFSCFRCRRQVEPCGILLRPLRMFAVAVRIVIVAGRWLA